MSPILKEIALKEGNGTLTKKDLKKLSDYLRKTYKLDQVKPLYKEQAETLKLTYGWTHSKLKCRCCLL